ncbi:MAG: amino acid--tRNA ligase-related protein, partial [Acidobacteriota bacterium]
MSIGNTQSETIFEAGIVEANDQTKARVEHLKELETLVGNSYPNKFERSEISGKEDVISNILAFAPIIEIVKELKDKTPEGEKPDQELKGKLNEKLKEFGNVRISGRLAVPPRVMGKAAFVHLSDGKSRLQIYVRKQDAKAIVNKSEPSAVADGLTAASDVSAKISDDNLQPPATADGSDVSGWEVFGLLDHGDFIGVEGYLFLTNTGELSVHVETLQFLSKALMPMPDKMHGIVDPELQRRFRYADLIADSLKIDHEEGELTTREVFERRAKLISGMRRFLDDAGYIEVETPMLTPKATGAAATPFETHHNALDIPLYARIAPELYLKRLTVGGFEKVYELNRNFRNEGLSHKHNPEFTMLEFYCAYMDVNGMMDFCEEMLKESVRKATGGNLEVNYDRRIIDFENFERIKMKDAVINSKLWKTYAEHGGPNFDETWLEDGLKLEKLAKFCKRIPGDVFTEKQVEATWTLVEEEYSIRTVPKRKIDEEQKGKYLLEIFEEEIEHNLVQPTFIIDYPKSISPLSKASPENPNIAERFELFINGMECANGFSELNDPQEQYE